MEKLNISYEVVLNKNIKINVYGYNKTYRKGLIITSFTKNEFERVFKNAETVEDNFTPCVCEGHGVYEYFNWKDLDVVKVETVIKTKKTLVKSVKKFLK